MEKIFYSIIEKTPISELLTWKMTRWQKSFYGCTFYHFDFINWRAFEFLLNNWHLFIILQQARSSTEISDVKFSIFYYFLYIFRYNSVNLALFRFSLFVQNPKQSKYLELVLKKFPFPSILLLTRFVRLEAVQEIITCKSTSFELQGRRFL